jgi:steroid 5-alpha reductase family enzyme
MTLPTLMAVSGGVIAGIMLLLWLLSLRLRDASIADIAWGPIFVVIAAVGAVGGLGGAGRQLLVLAMVGLWGLRLGWHIHRRNKGKGEDPRYVKWREQHGDSWWWVSLFRVFLLQGAFLWVISLPIQLAMGLEGADRFTAWDAVGELLWAAGFLVEAIADAQLQAFKDNPEKSGILDDGLWRWSRHPNYFGEAVLWWGIWLPALAVPWGWATVISPIVITLLLRYVSGVPLAEKLMEGRPGWEAYTRRVRIFVPGPRAES